MRFLFITFVLLLSSAFADDLQDGFLTPGLIRTDITQQQICTIKWGKDARAVTAQMKAIVFKEYGYNGNNDKRCPCEIDHLISRELGGADDIRNLWVQSYSGAWNAHMKDRLENRLHKEVCTGKISLMEAQNQILDWVAAYKLRYR